MLALLHERLQMRAQALRIGIKRGLGIDLGQTIAHKVGRYHPTWQRLGNGPTAQVVEEQVVRLRATAVVLVQDIAQGHLNRIGEEVHLGLVSRFVAGGDALRSRDVDLKNPMIGSVEMLTEILPCCQTSMPSKLAEVSAA